MTLSEFIRDTGNAEAAALFGEPLRTVMSWRYGARRPRPQTAHKIVAATDGRVRLEDIYPVPEESRG